MDDRLYKALDASKLRLNLLNIKENLKIKVETMITVAINGGIFKANRDLISFLQTIIDKGYETVVLIDDNKNPIEITDIPVFQEDLIERYFAATNYYNTEYTRLKNARTSSAQFIELPEGFNK